MTFCPSCGFNLTRDEVLEADGFVLDPRGVIAHRGRPIPLSRHQAIIMHAVAACHGRPVQRFVLADRLGSNQDGKTIEVQISKLRSMLRAEAVPDPIQTIRNRGYAWGLA